MSSVGAEKQLSGGTADGLQLGFKRREHQPAQAGKTSSKVMAQASSVRSAKASGSLRRAAKFSAGRGGGKVPEG